MKKPLAAHRNYSNIEIVLLFAMVFMIAAIALYVHNAQTNADDYLGNQTNLLNTPKGIITGSVAPSEAAATIKSGVYSSPSKMFTIRLADGWMLSQSQVSPYTLSTNNNESLAPKLGVAPIISNASDGGDNTTVLSIRLMSAKDAPKPRGTKTSDLVTNDGLGISKYVYSDPSTGNMQYFYLIPAQDRVFVAQYTVTAAMTSYRNTIETVIRSVRFN
jgi:hypothetical protein